MVLKQRIFCGFMGLDPGDIQPFQQPTQFACRYLDGNFLSCTWPPEPLLFKTTVEEPESIVVRAQAFDLVTPPIGEGVQPAIEGIMPQFLFQDRCQPMKAFTKIPGVAIEVDVRHLIGRPEVIAHDSLFNS